MRKHPLILSEDGSFILNNAEDFSYLYMPLFNEHGILSAITPSLAGDVKLDQFNYGLTPVTSEDLMNGISGRNVFFLVDGDLWSMSGKTPFQKLHPDEVALSGGLVYQNVKRSNSRFEVSVTSFVPTEAIHAELHRFIYKNISNIPQSVRITTGIPIYGRSADNIRDHHHVTALLNRAHVVQDGIINEPSMKFDERGHRGNTACYGVYAKSNRHASVSRYLPLSHEFIGEGQDLFYPLAPREKTEKTHLVGEIHSGFEVMGGLGFDELTIEPDQTVELLIGIFIAPNLSSMTKEAQKYLDFSNFDRLFAKMTDYWQNDLQAIDFKLSDGSMSGWTKWVSLQPTMRRLFGCSFLPHHDYGRGGRGWRDLWQDSLSLIFKEPQKVRPDILGHFAGVRIDGSNATIVGIKPGEFLADRNKIVRIWSDHGAWPLLTVERYIARTGDIDFLFEKQTYFKDKFACYTHERDTLFNETSTNRLIDVKDHEYSGTILEHLLLENIVPFYNVGEKGNLRLEDADWNDGMDMAKDKGETVAFTAFYAGNLFRLAELLRYMRNSGIDSISVLKEVLPLFDTGYEPIDYHNIKAKKQLLKAYFNSVRHQVSGETVLMPIQVAIDDLMKKYAFFHEHLNRNEWMETSDASEGWFNGYYDNQSNRLESTDPLLPKMTLTGQTFILMSKLVSKPRIEKIIQAVNHHLMDDLIKIPRLNTDFHLNSMKMGRFMGFAYGHKENGSMFSHMAVMYAFSLFENDFVEEGREIIDHIYHYMSDVDRSKMLPGIAEYIDSEGRGMYHYLTGSASWLMLTYIEQVFGIKGYYGDLVVSPRLKASDFQSGFDVRINTVINGHLCRIHFENPEQLNYREYLIESVNGQKVHESTFIIQKATVNKPESYHVVLGRIK